MSGNVQKDSGSIILCDMCTEEDRKPARKTCMKCEISMCVQHLQAHLTTPVLLQTHPLTEPMAIDGNTKCPQHGKLLEYYCLDDMTCVCVSCAIEDQHRIHNMKTFSTAHRELMEKLKAEQQVLQEKTDDQNLSLEKWEQSEREKLVRCGVRLIEAVTNLQDVSLTSVQSSVSARMVAIRTSKSSIEAAQKEKDTFRFLQMYSQVNQDVEKAKAVDLRKGLEPGIHCDKLVQEIRQKGEKITKHTSDLIGSLLILVDPDHHQELKATSSDLIFKPQIICPGLSLSKDSRKVYYNSATGQLPPSMLCVESMLSDLNFSRWVISLSADCDWTIGVCDKLYATNMKDGHVCGLHGYGQQLFSLTMEERMDDVPRSEFKKEQLMPGQKLMASQKEISSLDETEEQKMTQPQIVEVMWSFPNTLSFFSRIGQYQRKEILTVKTRSAISDRVFFVSLEKKEVKMTLKDNSDSSGYNRQNASQLGTGSLFGQPISSSQTAFSFGTSTVKHQVQKQWNCSCGKVYTETSGGYQCGGHFYNNSSNPSCSCGRVIGSSITEVLCELV